MKKVFNVVGQNSVEELFDGKISQICPTTSYDGSWKLFFTSNKNNNFVRKNFSFDVVVQRYFRNLRKNSKIFEPSDKCSTFDDVASAKTELLPADTVRFCFLDIGAVVALLV